MTVKIYSAASDQTKSYSGTPEQLLEQLRAVYKFIDKYPTHSLACALKHIARQQNYFVEVEQ